MNQRIKNILNANTALTNLSRKKCRQDGYLPKDEKADINELNFILKSMLEDAGALTLDTVGEFGIYALSGNKFKDDLSAAFDEVKNMPSFSRIRKLTTNYRNLIIMQYEDRPGGVPSQNLTYFNENAITLKDGADVPTFLHELFHASYTNNRDVYFSEFNFRNYFLSYMIEENAVNANLFHNLSSADSGYKWMDFISASKLYQPFYRELFQTPKSASEYFLALTGEVVENYTNFMNAVYGYQGRIAHGEPQSSKVFSAEYFLNTLDSSIAPAQVPKLMVMENIYDGFQTERILQKADEVFQIAPEAKVLEIRTRLIHENEKNAR